VPERGPGLDGSADLKQRVRTAAFECGFDQVGFAPAEAPPHADVYRRWLERGHHGEMAYMAREDSVRRRLDPREALPGCRSIVVVSLLYGPGEGPTDASRGSSALGPVVARYAAGRDYHDVFEERLDRLIEAIRAVSPEGTVRRYVDYGPVLERDHAQRAGLGWIGKNTMLIHPKLGSYLMLGEILTDLDVRPDEPFVADRCGTCERCIVACPTDAILEDRTLDARRCISYLTIELRESIPVELREAIGTRVFGCDICQEVCPWNTDAPTPARSPFGADPGRPVRPDEMVVWARELLALDDAAFRATYRGSVFFRPGRDGLLRNLAIGLGNSRDSAAGAVLEEMARDDSNLVAEHARWGLDRLREASR